MKIIAIIQARMGSTRLPGKVLMDLVGETVLGHVISRVRQATLIDQVAIATTTSTSDEKIVDEARRLGVPAFRGSERDVLDRYWQTSQKYTGEVIVRITSDCPLIDPQLIDETIRTFLEQHADYASNDRPPTYPRGLDCEVFTIAALEQAWRHAREPYEREHVTPYFYEHPQLFRLASLNCSADYSQHRWTLDTSEDLELVRAIYDRFPDCDHVSWRQILALVEAEPALRTINAHVRQKQLLES